MYRDNCFLTLTYDEKKPEYHNNFEYSDIQKFKKRLRAHVQRNHNGKKIEIFNVHEYGKNQKKHWHLIVFNWSDHDRTNYKRTEAGILSTSPVLSKLWPFGFNTHGDVSEASAMYQSQYVQKDIGNGNRKGRRKSHSKHSGLGGRWFRENYKQVLQLGYIPFSGRKVPVPRYFEKIAHKHYCHFGDQSYFFDNKQRKAIYRPFKKEEPNFELACLYPGYKHQKELLVKEFEIEWNNILSEHIKTKEEMDFQKSGSNLLYDLKNKTASGDF